LRWRWQSELAADRRESCEGRTACFAERAATKTARKTLSFFQICFYFLSKLEWVVRRGRRCFKKNSASSADTIDELPQEGVQ